MRSTLAVLAIVLSGCAPDRLEIEPLAEGEWMVLDAMAQPAILLQMRSATRHAPRGAAAEQPQIRLLADTLERAVTDTVIAAFGTTSLHLTRVRANNHEFYHNPAGRPRLVRSPTEPNFYMFEHEDAIWMWRASDRTVNKLSRDDELAVLRTRQREGEVILYWTADPAWTGDGAFISFLTNRTGVRSGRATQGIRVIQIATGVEKTIFDSLGVSVHVDGVLGEELIYSSSAAPGVFAVHPRTAATRAVASGYLMGSHPGGRGIVVNEGGRLTILTGNAQDTLPAPPHGFIYTSHAFFSASGRRVALFSTNERGGYRLHVYDVDRKRLLNEAVPGGPAYGPAWVSEDAVIFAAASPASPLMTYRAEIH